MNSLSVGLPFFLILVMFRLRACFYLLLMHLYCSLSLSLTFFSGVWGFGRNGQIAARHSSGGFASLCKSESLPPSSVTDLAATGIRAGLGNAFVFSHLAATCQLSLYPRLSEGWKPDTSAAILQLCCSDKVL